ncbi:MAG: DUF302 domain-containing protein [Cyclobacteriaceae bacterium]|nr:DUF302 domain-containing protein [Cyclobacteriaceae bacterium]
MRNLLQFIVITLLLISCSKSSKNNVIADKNNNSTTKVINEKKKEPSNYVITKSGLTANEIVQNLKQSINERGLTIFSEFSHHKSAQEVGYELSFNHVIVFGNPKIGTKLMQCDQKIGLELPLKVLVYTNKKGNTFISYTKPQFYNENYRLGKCKKVLNNIGKMLKQLTQEAANKNN